MTERGRGTRGLPVPSLASTGMATGRLMAGRLTTTAAITQLLPYPSSQAPTRSGRGTTTLPAPSCRAFGTGCHRSRRPPAPRRAPAAPPPASPRPGPARPGSTGRGRRTGAPGSWLQQRARPAPARMPHTVRYPGWARNPQARPQNVRNDGAVNNGARPASSVISDAGTGSVACTSVGGNPFHRRFHKAPPMLLSVPLPAVSPDRTECRGPGNHVSRTPCQGR